MRSMSVALTTDQIRRQTKTVTRRTGWLFMKPGDRLQPVVKARGIKKGEHVETIGGPIEVVSVRRERLEEMTKDGSYGRMEVEREGFGGQMSPRQFVDFFCATHGCAVRDQVTRIEFRYVERDAEVDQ
jgi:hypothetical protein